jgi:tetratricopeptide (TPR) repeat protein
LKPKPNLGDAMRIRSLLALLASSFVVGCANPVNRATSDGYAETCASAERSGRFDVAEEACYRALVNVDLGNLGPESKSQKLYNLARIKKRVGKFAEAEDLLKQSLQIEESLSGATSPQSGRRLVELAANLAAQDKWHEGADYLTLALPMADRFSGQERSYTKVLLQTYVVELNKLGQMQLAAQFDAKAGTL